MSLVLIKGPQEKRERGLIKSKRGEETVKSGRGRENLLSKQPEGDHGRRGNRMQILVHLEGSRVHRI